MLWATLTYSLLRLAEKTQNAAETFVAVITRLV